MAIEDFLKRATHLDALIDSHVAELDRYRRLSMKIGGSRLEERVSHSAPREAPYAKWVENIVDKESEINEEIERLLNIKLEISGFIDKVDNPEWQYILRSRYIMGLPWEQIAKGMGCSVSTVKRAHRNALDDLNRFDSI